jgi:uncharacterized protein with PhoU and TrkA domain
MRAKLRVAGRKESRWLELPAGAVLERIKVPVVLAGRSLGSLDLTGEHGLQVLVLLERDELGHERRAYPSADSVLGDGMELVVYGAREDVHAFLALHGERAPER